MPASHAALHRRLAEQLASCELTFGYNGLGRLTGDETGSVGGGGRGGGGTAMWGATGIGRLFDAEIGGQIAWLLPGRAGARLVAGLVAAGRAPRTDARRAALARSGAAGCSSPG